MSSDSRPLKPNRANQRSARFAAAQAMLSPQQLEEQQLQNRTPSTKLLAHTTVYELKMAKRWFVEFMEDQHPDVDVETSFFTPDVSPSDVVLLKEYARYLVRSRVGRVTDKLSVITVQHYMKMILFVMEREAKHQSLLSIRDELHIFAASELVTQEGIGIKMYTKAVAHTEDLTFIISRLYHPNYLNTFSNMRTVLNLTLYMALVVDLCGRGADIARHPLRPKHMCLCWEDINFYTFQSEDDDSFDIRALVNVRWSKGQSQDESLYRTASFPGLLPTHMALEDTLRLLLITALMDDVFENGITSWDELYRLRLPPSLAGTGQRLMIKKDMLSVPLLRRMEKHSLTNEPALTVELQAQISRLGRFCGFENRLIAYCLRRGVAYVLATKTTAENRRFLMGHRPRSMAYSAYHSRISTIDFPAMFRDIETRPVTALSGISLNRSDEVPLRISEQGMQKVMLQDDVQAATKELDNIRAAILQKHPGLSAAARTSDPLWEDYRVAYRIRRSLMESVVRRVYAEEYKQHHKERARKFSSNSPMVGSLSSSDDTQPKQFVAAINQDLSPTSSKTRRASSLATRPVLPGFGPRT